MTNFKYREPLGNRIIRYILIGLLLIAFPFIEIVEWIVNTFKLNRQWSGKEGLFWVPLGALIMSITTIALVILLVVVILRILQ